MSDSRVAVVFGSAFLGFPTHFGFLKGLAAAGINPAAVSGSSSGSIVAGFYAAGLGIENIEEIFTQKHLRKKFRERFLFPRMLAVLLCLPGRAGVFKGTTLQKFLASVLGDKRIEDCDAARLKIAVANLRTNRVELRDRGSLVETILASCALPGVIAPRKIDGELLWDGGLGSSVPIEAWMDDPEITHIITHSIVNEGQLSGRERSHRYNFPAAMLAGHQLTADELLRWKLELARRNGKKVVPAETISPTPRLGIPLTLPPKKPWPDHARDLMALGEASARTVVEGLKRDGETPAASC